MPVQVQIVNGAGSVGGVGTGAGYVGQVRSSCGFDVAVFAMPALARALA
jgi:hypothetical protein